MSPFFTIFHRLHHHFPDENPYRCIFHLRAHAEGLTRGCRLGCATSGENGGIFQWRLRWCAKHLTITSFFKCEESRNWPWFTSGEKNSGLTIKFGWNKCGLSMWRIHCENLHATGNLCIYLSIDLSTYLSIYLVISYRTSYLSLYL